mgnify:CR=1 FL=1
MMDCFDKIGFAPGRSHHVLVSGNSVVFYLGEKKYQVRDRISGELQLELEYSGIDEAKEVVSLGSLGWAIRGFGVLDIYARGKGGRFEHNSYPTCVNAIDGALYIPATGVILVYEWVDTLYNRGDFNRLSFIAPETAECFHQLKVPEGNVSFVTEVRTDGSLVLYCGEKSSELDEKGYGIKKFRDTDDIYWAFINGISLSYEDARERLKFNESIVVGRHGGEIVGYSTSDGVLRACRYDGPEFPHIELPPGISTVGKKRLVNGNILIILTPDPSLLRMDLAKGEVEVVDLPETLSIHGHSQDPVLILNSGADKVYFYDADSSSLKPSPFSIAGSPWFYHLNHNTVIAQAQDRAKSVKLIDVGKDDILVSELPVMNGASNISTDGVDDLWIAVGEESYRCSIKDLKESCFGS